MKKYFGVSNSADKFTSYFFHVYDWIKVAMQGIHGLEHSLHIELGDVLEELAVLRGLLHRSQCHP